MHQQSLHDPLQQSRIEGSRHFQQHRHIPMVEVKKVLVKEPPLDGQEGQWAGHQVLFGSDSLRPVSHRR